MALGSNLGDRERYFSQAVAGLEKEGFHVEEISPFYETAPVDCEDGVPPFLNGVLKGSWSGSAESLLDLCQKLERDAGRAVDHSSRESRTLDLDLILFGDQCIRTGRLTVPHPRAQIRQFVLKGLCLIAPETRFPDSGRRADSLLRSLIEEEGEL